VVAARGPVGCLPHPRRRQRSLGPYIIDVGTADRAAAELCRAIYMAAREVDKKDTAELRAKTIRALTNSGIPCESPEYALMVSPGWDLRIWLTFRPEAIAGITSVNCLNGLSPTSQALIFASYNHQSHRARTRLNAWHEALYVEPNPQT
jgi:hypothetical protein